MVVREFDNALEKKLGAVISNVLTAHSTIYNKVSGGFVKILNADLKIDDKDKYYIHCDLYIKTPNFITYSPKIEAVVVKQFNAVAFNSFKITVKVKVRDYTLIVDAGEYEIIYTKKVQRKDG